MKDLLKIFLLVLIVIFTTSAVFSQSGVLKREYNRSSQSQSLVISNKSQTDDSNGIRTNYELDFEGIEDFSLEFAPWTVIDVDSADTYGFEGYTFPNDHEPMAFIVFNPSNTNPPMVDQAIQPHSGLKFGACFDCLAPPNDDWLISPQITLEKNSNLTFWVKSYTDDYGLELYNVAVSTSGNSPDDFVIISGSTPKEAPAETWTEEYYDLSDYDHQTVYVAIQCVSSDAFVFMVDDIIIHTEPSGVVDSDDINSNGRISVYPVPAEQTINIEADLEIENVRIVNFVGQTVYEENINSTQSTINISHMESGIYLMVFKTKKGLLSKKVTIK
ncbi:MAG: choice-of-anchor J domain-containing protein [Bacteroidales bacterium]|nr:choice-of-anchor J domain-containing protein [Bacteroidales bacterium]